jgi:hypothetical protein
MQPAGHIPQPLGPQQDPLLLLLAALGGSDGSASGSIRADALAAYMQEAYSRALDYVAGCNLHDPQLHSLQVSAACLQHWTLVHVPLAPLFNSLEISNAAATRPSRAPELHCCH